MSKFIDLTGQRFNRLTVIERAGSKNGFAAWKCLCECGNITVVRSSHLKSGHIKSCGCLNRERITKHGMQGTPIYRVWHGIKARCLNPNDLAYKNYGGRGISMFPAWVEDIKAFCEYVSRLEHFNEDDYSLDRIDDNGNYEPGNLRWADIGTQNRNKRNNVIVEYNGVEMCLKAAAESSGIPYSTLQYRYKHGDRGERLFRAVK